MRLRSLVLAIALVAASCGGGSGDAAAPSTTTPTTSTTTVAETTTTTEPVDPVLVSLDDAVLTESELAALVEAAPELTPQQIGQLWLFERMGETVVLERGLDPEDWISSAQSDLLTVEWGTPYFSLLASIGAHRLAVEAEFRSTVDVGATEPPELVCFSFITVATEAEAEEVAALLRDGADFVPLAQQRSLDDVYRPGGGNARCQPFELWIADFEAPFRAAGVGIVDPFPALEGWLVAEIRSLGPATVEVHPELSEEEVLAAQLLVVDRLAAEVGDEFEFDVLRRLASAGGITVDESFGVWDADSLVIRPADG